MSGPISFNPGSLNNYRNNIAAKLSGEQLLHTTMKMTGGKGKQKGAYPDGRVG